MDLRELRFALRRHWAGALVVFLACTGLGVAGAYLPEERYEATAQVFVQPQGRAAESAQAATFVLPGMVAKLQTRSFRLEAQSRVPPEYRDAPLVVTATSNASVLSVTVEGPQPQPVAVWANALVAELVQGEAVGDFLTLSILDEATVPASPVFPQPVPILAGSIALGALAAVFVAVLALRVRRAFDLKEDVRQILGTRLLGELPRAPEVRHSSDLVALLEDGDSDLDDAFHNVRVEVERHLVGTGARSVAVLAQRSGQGASTVALGLAWSLAKVGYPVSIVDADIRQPSLARSGRGTTEPRERELRRHRPLRPVGSGDRPFLELSALDSGDGRTIEAMARTLPEALEERAGDERFTIVDSPPLRRIGEARIAAGATRRVILVVDRSDWDPPALSEAVLRLEDLGSEVVGVVVNRVPVRRWRLRRRRRVSARPAAPDPTIDDEARGGNDGADERVEPADDVERADLDGAEVAEDRQEQDRDPRPQWSAASVPRSGLVGGTGVQRISHDLRP